MADGKMEMEMEMKMKMITINKKLTSHSDDCEPSMVIVPFIETIKLLSPILTPTCK